MNNEQSYNIMLKVAEQMEKKSHIGCDNNNNQQQHKYPFKG